MPLYEYRCDDCGHDFEVLVRGVSDRPRCPSCGTEALTKQLSIPSAARSAGASGASLPVCDAPLPSSGGCAAMGCGGGFCAMDGS